jgi:hypothetical protein
MLPVATNRGYLMPKLIIIPKLHLNQFKTQKEEGAKRPLLFEGRSYSLYSSRLDVAALRAATSNLGFIYDKIKSQKKVVAFMSL